MSNHDEQSSSGTPISNRNDQPGLGTPPFGRYAYPPSSAPYVLPVGRLGGYTSADFPAPAGVLPMMENQVPVALKTRSGGRIGTLIAAVSLSAVIGAGAGIGSYAYVNEATPGVSPISVTTVPAAQTPALNGTISAAAAKIQPSVVTIAVQTGSSGGVGTGVVLDTAGHILTNDHVVAAARQSGEITVTFSDGTTARATIIGTSPSNDLAVIKVAASPTLSPAIFAKSGSLQIGQTVIATGAPLGLSQSVTSGIVSNTARPVRSGSNGDAVYLALQTDAAINPGNSGGPLVNVNGAVVGINSSIASTGSGNGSSQSGNIGIGFAIPADVAVRVAAELIADGTSTNAAMGVTIAGSDSQLPTATGVTLQTVVSGGAAQQAGLQARDVVTKINDFHTTTADGLIAATRFYAPGTTVSVTYTRDGKTTSADVTLGSN
jgi:putative serine protease PepD